MARTTEAERALVHLATAQRILDSMARGLDTSWSVTVLALGEEIKGAQGVLRLRVARTEAMRLRLRAAAEAEPARGMDPLPGMPEQGLG